MRADFEEMEILASSSDVEAYVRERIAHEPRLARLLKGDPALTREIGITIVERGGGMYVSRCCILYQENR
jgi:hypothetical protein